MSLHKIHTRMVFGPDGQVEEDEFYWHDTEVDGPIAMAQGGDYRQEQLLKQQREQAARKKAQKTTVGKKAAAIPAGAKSFEAWSGKAKKLGWSPERSGQSAYEGYLHNVRTGKYSKKSKSSAPSAPAAPAPAPVPEKTLLEKFPLPERPKYEGPAYDPNESITPVATTLKPVEENEFVENRISSMLDRNSPLFRQASEAQLRALANRGLGSNSSMAQEEVMRAIFAIAAPIAEADARMLERHRTLNNTAYFQEMDSRLKGVIQKALAHIAGGYQMQASTMQDLTNQWKVQVEADLKKYGIDVSAAMQQYAADMGMEQTRYMADIQEMIGMEGIKIDQAQILADITDNPEASAYLQQFFTDGTTLSEWVTQTAPSWQNE